MPRDYGENMKPVTKAILVLENYRCPSDICQTLKRLDIRSYAYSFWTWEGIIKAGESCDNSLSYGERIYRQAWWIPGWDTQPCSSSGAEMMLIAKEFEQVHERVLHKDSVFIQIYDTTEFDDPKQKGIEFERYLIDTCIQHTGRAPIGNKDPKTKLAVAQHHNQKGIDRLFDTHE